MFVRKGLRDIFFEERRNNAKLRAEQEKAAANIEYIAMMSDIELDDETESEDDEE